jgi:hypothetical protein
VWFQELIIADFHEIFRFIFVSLPLFRFVSFSFRFRFPFFRFEAKSFSLHFRFISLRTENERRTLLHRILKKAIGTTVYHEQPFVYFSNVCI